MKKFTILSLMFVVIFSACSKPAQTLTVPSTSAPDLDIEVNVSATSLPTPTPTMRPTEASSTGDCHRIAFAMFNYQNKEQPDIYTVCPNGSQMTRLTDDPAVDENPAWSPDGRRLAFISDRSGSNQIYLMDADGSHVTQVTKDYNNTLPVWLPDGAKIAFRTNDDKGLWWWRIANLDGSQITQFTTPSYDFFFQTPAWSPDGRKMAYMSLEEQKERNDGASQIHVKNIDGSRDVALTHDTWENAYPIWSPDGQQIAFLSERHGEYNIFALYVMRADGSHVRQLSRPVYGDAYTRYSWSPDGTQIAIGDINTGRIDIISIATGETHPLLELDEGEAVFSPSWQP